jgi:hypothetical protein
MRALLEMNLVRCPKFAPLNPLVTVASETVSTLMRRVIEQLHSGTSLHYCILTTERVSRHVAQYQLPKKMLLFSGPKCLHFDAQQPPSFVYNSKLNFWRRGELHFVHKPLINLALFSR